MTDALDHAITDADRAVARERQRDLLIAMARSVTR